MTVVDVLMLIVVTRGSDRLNSDTQKITMPSKELCIATANFYNNRIHKDDPHNSREKTWQVTYDATCIKEAR